MVTARGCYRRAATRKAHTSPPMTATRSSPPAMRLNGVQGSASMIAHTIAPWHNTHPRPSKPGGRLWLVTHAPTAAPPSPTSASAPRAERGWTRWRGGEGPPTRSSSSGRHLPMTRHGSPRWSPRRSRPPPARRVAPPTQLPTAIARSAAPVSPANSYRLPPSHRWGLRPDSGLSSPYRRC